MNLPEGISLSTMKPISLQSTIPVHKGFLIYFKLRKDSKAKNWVMFSKSNKSSPYFTMFFKWDT